jgi:hypothetical protein
MMIQLGHGNPAGCRGEKNEPLQFEGLQPDETIVDDDPSPRRYAHIAVYLMKCAAYTDDHVAGRAFGEHRLIDQQSPLNSI